MITYAREADEVTLTMDVDEWERLLIMVGSATGLAAFRNDKKEFYRWLRFVNDLNATNPRFTPYKIPEEFAEKRPADIERGKTP